MAVDEWQMDFLNDDEWNRTTLFQDDSPVGGVVGDNWYTLTRILKEDGNPTRFWSEYLNSEDGRSAQQIFVTDSACMRKCKIAVPSCRLCTLTCR